MVLDLQWVDGWSRAGICALADLLDDPETHLDLVPPHVTTFLELLRATNLRDTWSAYRQVRRVM